MAVNVIKAMLFLHRSAARRSRPGPDSVREPPYQLRLTSLHLQLWEHANLLWSRSWSELRLIVDGSRLRVFHRGQEAGVRGIEPPGTAQEVPYRLDPFGGSGARPPQARRRSLAGLPRVPPDSGRTHPRRRSTAPLRGSRTGRRGGGALLPLLSAAQEVPRVPLYKQGIVEE